MYKNKSNPPPKPRTIYQLRQAMLESGFEAKNDINEPKSTLITKHTINIDSKLCSTLKDLTYYRVSYRGSNIQNGIVIMCHGGGYGTKSPLRNFSFAELVSKITGYIVMILDYKLSPEYKVSYSISEVVEFYKYIVTNPMYKDIPIAMEGDSCGGGMVLSALQIIKKEYYSLKMPNAIWLNSAWTQLDIGKCKSHERNANIDGVVGLGLLSRYADWAVGKIDGDLNVLCTEDEVKKIRYEYSAINGDFEGLCPMYFMVGGTELLLDDSLECARKAYESGNDVIVDVEAYMLHVYAIRVNMFPEAVEATKKGCTFLEKYMGKSKLVSRL